MIEDDPLSDPPTASGLCRRAARFVHGLALAAAVGCTDRPPLVEEDPVVDDDRVSDRLMMVETQIAARGVSDERVLAAMRDVPRHRFVPPDVRRHAYIDRPLPIGYRQTISQPYIVAFMSEALELSGDERVLEIGTGSGYQAAILARLAAEVYSIEIVPELADRADATLRSEGFDRVHVRAGDGYRGWPEVAPFDAIILTAAPDHVPQPLVEQLAVGGLMVLPVGDFYQELIILERTEAGVERRVLAPVRFVPMTGEARNGHQRP
jgi:protein-L-isoaspartate(D-aspartate) O-methyltransferase